MNLLQYALLIGIILAFGTAEIVTGKYREFRPTSDDTKLELFQFVALLAVVQPLIFATTNALCAAWMPDAAQAWAGLPWWGMTAILLVGDDLTQYAWHRVSHTALLWPLHRAHHSAHYMSVRVVYRNNFFYYLMMPGVWISGVLIYLGFANVYLVYVVVKLAVIMGAHSAVRWDEPLYRRRWLHPVAWVLERVFSTPATHWAHHALTNDDGIGHYKGNYGNLLFIWDLLFGTAKLTRQYPPRVGLPDDLAFGKERWFVEMFYPVFQSRRAHSALAPGGAAYSDEQTRAARASQPAES